MAELNDPFDCHPQMTHFPPGSPNDPGFHRGFLKQLMAHIGVLCYSESINDPVMWSHYAEKHRGLALGFDFSESKQQPRKLHYNKNRPILDFTLLNAHNQNSPNTALDRVIEDGFMTKAPSWKYEMEYRQFIKLDACTIIGRNYFQNIPINALTKVVIGERCDFTLIDVNRILYPNQSNLCSPIQSHTAYPRDVKIRQCVMNESSFEFNFRDFSLISHSGVGVSQPTR